MTLVEDGPEGVAEAARKAWLVMNPSNPSSPKFASKEAFVLWARNEREKAAKVVIGTVRRSPWPACGT